MTTKAYSGFTREHKTLQLQYSFSVGSSRFKWDLFYKDCVHDNKLVGLLISLLNLFNWASQTIEPFFFFFCLTNTFSNKLVSLVYLPGNKNKPTDSSS